MINDYWVYITLAIAVTAIPGPAVVLTIKNSLVYGYKTAIVNIFANFIAMLILATLSAFGLGAIILSSTLLFSLVKVLGAIYLVYLGIKIWRSPSQIENTQDSSQARSSKSLVAVFKEGFIVGVSNPKAIAFFTALFPQFIDVSRAFVPQFLTLILTIEGISITIMIGYALLAAMASPFLSKPSTMKVFNRLTGTAFVGFGAALAYGK